MRDGGHLHKIAEVRADLGESPIWDKDNRLLYFVDISGGKINVMTPQARVATVYQSSARIGALALTDRGNLIFTEDARVAILDPKQGVLRTHSSAVHNQASYRFNDGACDPQGRFITGLMHEGPNREAGALYRYDSELSAQAIQRNIALPNGLAWSEYDHTLFFVDSIARSIFRAAYAPNGELGAVMCFAETPAELGRPDGITLDRAGGLWVCMFNGGCLLHYDRNGSLSGRVAMPVPRPTSCCFGGEGLETLFITTARFAMTASELAEYPDSGDLFAIRPAIAGVPRHLFKECKIGE
ncbi:SMP-30/gluconolactonase/LRE family protein [Serratia fonticola]|uniref:SMP-30/gluconolactonase/LRE family protein n=1 Tax=Serratia fonticola TaxID=47917 RepID=UPI000E2CD69A|nr:SMP-30/gluconolactonase/LRE family protein [Serratia fonticola]RDL27439.1 sugar lactone lactonase YvrE [Serratia fonticola]